jgi:hypothetical protein
MLFLSVLMKCQIQDAKHRDWEASNAKQQNVNLRFWICQLFYIKLKQAEVRQMQMFWHLTKAWKTLEQKLNWTEMKTNILFEIIWASDFNNC